MNGDVDGTMTDGNERRLRLRRTTMAMDDDYNGEGDDTTE
jgi:hypothetical protein